MKIIDALEKLESISPGELVSAEYTLTKNDVGRRYQRCGLYFRNTYFFGDTWEEAFIKIKGKSAITEPELEDSLDKA